MESIFQNVTYGIPLLLSDIYPLKLKLSFVHSFCPESIDIVTYCLSTPYRYNLIKNNIKFNLIFMLSCVDFLLEKCTLQQKRKAFFNHRFSIDLDFVLFVMYVIFFFTKSWSGMCRLSTELNCVHFVFYISVIKLCVN